MSSNYFAHELSKFLNYILFHLNRFSLYRLIRHMIKQIYELFSLLYSWVLNRKTNSIFKYNELNTEARYV